MEGVRPMGWGYGTCTTATWKVPTAAQFQAQFVRDFNYAPASDPNNLNYVTVADINQAISNAQQNFNPNAFGVGQNLVNPNPNNLANATNVFLYLSAFYLCWNLQNSAKGVSSQTNFPINSKSAGGVAVTYTVPERYAKSPILSIYTQNGYGMVYLSLVLPYTVGNVKLIPGTTTYT